ncbi:hypothetical protein MAJ_04907, partial [Metarhizium majus ARSEF 297]
MSQVKNLRAMFENKGDTSPPDRGRSPGITPSRHIGNASSNGSPRPLSKVRTNFVAIEKDGRMGLRRDHSGESSLSRRRMSTETADTEFNSNYLENPKTVPSDDVSKASRRNIASETIPESPRTTSHEQAGVSVDAGSQLDKAHMEVKMKLGSPPHLQSEERGTGTAGNAELNSVSATNRSHGIKHKGHLSVQAKMMTTGPTKGFSATSAARPESRAANRGLKISTLSADKTQKANTGATSSTKARTVPSGVVAKSQPVKTKSQNDAGFIKPKPKSPTKQVQMPSSLTAPTASSVSKVHVSRRPLSRQSGTQNNPAQPSIRPNMSNSTASHSFIKGQGSSSSRSRPSLGPPPNKQPQVTASNKKQSNVDEGFLARMMRPTQSSSSKATDKAPVTPPKRTAQRPVGGENGNQALLRSASGRGLHGKRIPVLASLQSTSAPLAGPTDEPDPPESEEECNELHIDTNIRSEIANADKEARSPPNPATKYTVEEKGVSAVPEGPKRFEALITGSTCNMNSAMNDLVHNSQLREEADDSKASVAAGPTPLVELMEASSSVGSDEIASKDKRPGAVEEVDDAAPEATSKQQNCKADLVSETKEIPQGPAGDSLANEEPVTAEGYESSDPVEMDLAAQHTPETCTSPFDVNQPYEQSIQQVIQSTRNHLVPEINSPSPSEIIQTDLGGDKPDGIPKMEAVSDEQKQLTVQGHEGTAEVALETEHA